MQNQSESPPGGTIYSAYSSMIRKLDQKFARLEDDRPRLVRRIILVFGMCSAFNADPSAIFEGIVPRILTEIKILGVEIW